MCARGGSLTSSYPPSVSSRVTRFRQPAPLPPGRSGRTPRCSHWRVRRMRCAQRRSLPQTRQGRTLERGPEGWAGFAGPQSRGGPWVVSLSRESLGGRQFTALFAVTSGGWSSSSSGWVTQVSSRFPDCNQCTKNLRIPAAPVSWVCTTSIRGVVAYWCDRRAGMSSPFWGSGAPGLSWSAWLSWKTLGLFPVRSLKHQSGRGPGMDPSTM